MVFAARDLWEGLERGGEDGALMVGSFPCEKRHQELASSLSHCTPPKGHVNTQQEEVAICNPKGESPPQILAPLAP